MSNPTSSNGRSIEDYFKYKYTFRGKRYGISTSAIKSRLKCYFTHVPFTRKWALQFHKLNCGALVICPLDGWVSDEKEIVQSMMDDPAFEVTLKKKGKS